MAVMTASALAAKCKDVAQNYKTLYVMGSWGLPLTEKNKERVIKGHSYNRKISRKPKIKAATADMFGFDCVCLIKAILWGWDGDKAHHYGGADFASNGVPDKSADQMIALCKDVSTDFSDIEVGEVVWMKGHIGVYIGGGLAVESTPIWADGVQITAVGNIGKCVGYRTRTWTKHGKLPFVSYEAKTTEGAKTVNIEMTVLKRGLKGEEVKTLQRILVALGYDLGASGVDGSFGGKTDAALRAYQKAEGLTVDGSCGKKTWTKLLKG